MASGQFPDRAIGRIHKRFAPIDPSSSREALGQIGGSGDLEADIALCSLQTIEPLMMKYLPRGGKILEAGSGRGRWVFYLRRKGYNVVGLEIARAEIAAAKAFDSSVPITEGNVLHTGFPDASFDAMISLGVVEHFEEGPGGALDEARRILKTGAVFLVTVPTQNFVRVALFNRIKNLQNSFRRIKGTHMAFEEYRYSRRQFELLVRRSGFDIIERVPDDFLPPLSMGLYTESRFLQDSTRQWRLNSIGRIVASLLNLYSPRLHSSGTLWVCRSR